MAKCMRCGRSGLSLKLDYMGFCPDCQALTKRVTDDRISNLESELFKLRAFHKEYSVIPQADIEAASILDEARNEAARILREAKEEAEKLLFEAKVSSDNLRNEADHYKRMTEFELDAKKKHAETYTAKIKTDAKLAVSYAEAQIAALLSSASKDFAYQSKATAAEAYSKSDESSAHEPPSLFNALSPAAFKREIKHGYVAFDLETTGLDKESHSIIEIGALKFDQYGNKIDTFSELINPGVPIPHAASSINGITDSMVANAPRIDEVLPNFYRFIGSLPIVAYNANFDVGFLANATKKLGLSVSGPINYGDSWAMAKKAYKLRSYKLSSVAEHLGISTSDAHRALGDCEMMGEILKDILFSKYRAE